MYDSHKSVPTVPAWLVIDSRGAAPLRPGHDPPAHPGADAAEVPDGGYLHQGATIRELAASIGVDPDGLERTVADTNRYARTGVDEEFGKGTSVFGHQYGDPAHTPNANLGPIETAPFYAIAVGRRRWAPRSGCAPTRPRRCSTRRAHRSLACTRAATTRSR